MGCYKKRYFIIKSGFYSIKIGGNFYRSTLSFTNAYSIGISIYDSNGVLFYEARSSDNYMKNLSTPILSGGINYQQFNAASTSVSLFLKSGYRIAPFYTTGGQIQESSNPTYMIPIKTFFDIVYANIEN